MIQGLAALAKGDVSREKIIEMNKSGEYQFSPVSIVPSAGGIEHNAGELKIFIDDSAAYLKNHLPKMDEPSVITMLDDVEQVFKWTKATRIKQTGSFEDVKKLFTAEEKRFQTEIIDVLKEKRESFLEALYAEREVKLREYVSEISEASEFEIDSSIFDATIEAKRSTDCAAIKGLRKPVKTLLDGILAVYVAPMIQAKKDAAEAARRSETASLRGTMEAKAPPVSTRSVWRGRSFRCTILSVHWDASTSIVRSAITR